MAIYIARHDALPRSITDCIQELKVIETGKLQRIANGELIKIKGPYKLWTRIVCQDVHILKSLNLELGAIMKIGCMHKLWKKVSPGKTIKLKHLVCESSIQGHDRQGQVLCHLMGDQEISIPENVEFISYRPWLNMMMVSFQTADNSWKLEAEEI